MSRYRITIQYNGSSFSGWQSQPDVNTVQDTLEQTMSTVLSQPITLHASGRTDAGVHALGQVGHFDCGDEVLLPQSKWQSLINDRLPPSITTHSLQRVESTFHARHDAVKRTYGYRFQCGRNQSLDFHNGRCLVRRTDWKPDRARELIRRFNRGVPTKNFSGSGGSTYESERWPLETRIRSRTPREIWMLVSAPSFRYRMVRCLAGAVVRSMSGEWDDQQVDNYLEGEHNTVPPAPASGCFLLAVSYGETDTPVLASGWEQVLNVFPQRS